MRKSFQQIYTELQDQTGDDSAAQLVIFKRHINDTQNIVLGDHPWKFLEKTVNITTAASTGRYTLAADLRKIITVTTTPDSGVTVYTPTPVEDPDEWEYLNTLRWSDSNQTRYFYQEGNDLLILPEYATASKRITVRYRKRVMEMSRADYTTGTITTATNADETIVGSSTSWTARNPVGEQWLRIDQTAGDYLWYRVESITDATNLELEAKYMGTSIAAGTSTYTMGEFPSFPGEYHNLCFYRPMALYYMKIENIAMADYYWNLYDGGYEAGKTRKPGGMLRKLIVEQAGMLDAKYFPRQGSERFATAEDLALQQTATLG